jgi:hypothetical protein
MHYLYKFFYLISYIPVPYHSNKYVYNFYLNIVKLPRQHMTFGVISDYGLNTSELYNLKKKKPEQREPRERTVRFC